MKKKDELLALNDHDLISELFDTAREQVEISPSGRVLLHLVTSTGVIDNGGARYFLEDDFQSGVSHREIAEEYSAIGMSQVTDCLMRALSVFPDGEVIGDLEMRNELLSRKEITEKLDLIDESLIPLLSDFEAKLGVYLRENITSLI